MSKQSEWLRRFMRKVTPKKLRPIDDKKNVNKSLHDMNREILNKAYDMKPGERRTRLVNQVRRNVNEKALSKEDQKLADEMIKRRQEATKRKRDADDARKRRRYNRMCTLDAVSCPPGVVDKNVKRERDTGAPWWKYKRGSKK